MKKYLKVSNLICVLQMTGKDMCVLSKQESARVIGVAGNILWEQQEVDRESAALNNARSNLSETSTAEPVAAHAASSVSPPRPPLRP